MLIEEERREMENYQEDPKKCKIPKIIKIIKNWNWLNGFTIRISAKYSHKHVQILHKELTKDDHKIDYAKSLTY